MQHITKDTFREHVEITNNCTPIARTNPPHRDAGPQAERQLAQQLKWKQTLSAKGDS